MGFYQFKFEQYINEPLETLWDFISSPKNLKRITPDYMGFEITSLDLSEKMYPGMIISYIVKPIFGIETTWVTEITHVKDKNYFIDEQRVGPYKMWHHEHWLKATEKGTLMTDIISYKPPVGIIGDIANVLFIEKRIKEVFAYREKALIEIFG